MAKTYEGQEDLLLGELQFAFIAFMVLQTKLLFLLLMNPLDYSLMYLGLSYVDGSVTGGFYAVESNSQSSFEL